MCVHRYFNEIDVVIKLNLLKLLGGESVNKVWL